MPLSFRKFLYVLRNQEQVSLLFEFFFPGWGSGNVIHISSTSSESKNEFMNSILVLRNAVFLSCFSVEVLAPRHILAPLISMPIKLQAGKRTDKPVVYSPFPQPSSR